VVELDPSTGIRLIAGARRAGDSAAGSASARSGHATAASPPGDGPRPRWLHPADRTTSPSRAHSSAQGGPPTLRPGLSR